VPPLVPIALPGVTTAAITNLGCKVNQAEVEAIGRALRDHGVRVGGDGRAVDLHVVNTCTVTAEADAKSRAAVRRARRASPGATVVVTGCSVSVDGPTFRELDPTATIIDNRAKDRLDDEIAALVGPLPTLDGAVPVGQPGDEEGTSRTRAFVKVQDGCSFYCTFCLIPRARGPERSLAPDVVLADIRRAIAAGHREIVLTGINIGTYDGGWSERGFRGSHRRSALTLAGLVRRILAETSVERLRLSSIEPQHLDDELLAAWVDGAPRTLPHVHLPLQSGDDGVLRRMGRRYDTAGYADTVGRARLAIPGLAVHADVMAGFPSEDEAAHERSMDFIRSLDVAGLHVFRYSERPGTAAVRMTGAVDARVRRRRAADLARLGDEAKVAFAATTLGDGRHVLFEERDARGRWIGRSEDYIAFAVDDDRPLANAIGTVRAERTDPAEPWRVVGRLLEAA
jgi:threonylcarbamoyladenosine tRNA methylthiotransferase MtaB